MKRQQATPFRYRAGTTVLHRMPAGFKLLCVIIISTAACFSVYGLAAAIFVILAASIAARIPPRQLLRGSKLLVIVSLCIILLKTFEQGGEGIVTPEILIAHFYIPDIYIPAVSANGFYVGIITALRIFVPFAAAALLFAVSTMRELRLSLAALEVKFSRKKNQTAYISLSICLMLGFIPRFFERWEAANLACDARSCKRGLRRLLLLLPLVTERMMESAADTALALQARGLAGGS